MEFVFYGLAALLGLLGLIFVVGSQGLASRVVVGLVLMGAGAALAYLARRPAAEQRTIIQRIELSGDISAKELKCTNCAATLDESSISVKAGAAIVNCAHCGTTYHLEEAPKW